VQISLLDVGFRGINERIEEEFLFSRILQPLEEAGLIGTIPLCSKGCQRDPAFSIIEPHTNNIKTVGDTKTHNLPLPMEAQSVATIYNAVRRTAVDEMIISLVLPHEVLSVVFNR
jgi:hypothetical protein